MFLCSCSQGFAPAKSLPCGSPEVIPLLVSSEVIRGSRQIDKCMICDGRVSETVSVCHEEQQSSGILEDKLQQLARRLITICWMVIVLEGKSCGVTSFGDPARDHDLLKTPTICLISLSLSLCLSLITNYLVDKLKLGFFYVWCIENMSQNEPTTALCVFRRRRKSHICVVFIDIASLETIFTLWKKKKWPSDLNLKWF